MEMTTKLISALALVVVASGCSKDDAGTPTTKAPASSEQPSRPAATGETPTTTAMLAEYEAIRVLLVNDTADGVAERATKLATIATALGTDAREPAAGHLSAAAQAARALAAADAGDLAAVRVAFGELSRPLVALVSADAALAAGVHTFECPMAEGYARWIQPTAELENPYMGQKMLACGQPVSSAPASAAP